MPHTYAFLWVLLLLRGNDIRFYRGKILKIFEKPNFSVRKSALYLIFIANKYIIALFL